MLVKLSCIVPATILAGLVRDLGVIIELTGLMGFVLILTPGVLLIKAQKECQQVFQTTESPFATVLSKKPLIITVIVFNLIGFALSVYSLISKLVM